MLRWFKLAWIANKNLLAQSCKPYMVPLQQVRTELELWKQPLLDEYRSLTEITGALKVKKDMELRRDPRFPQMEVAPDMLVPIR